VCSSEGTARGSTAPYQLACIVYSEIPEQVIFKLYGKSPNCFSARVPEVTSMQVFECIGEEWKIPTPDILA
jgi:hypothetical protein